MKRARLHWCSVLPLLLVSGASILLAVLLPIGVAYQSIRYGGYAFCFVLLCLWAFIGAPFLIRLAKASFADSKKVALGLLLLLFSCMVFLSVDQEFRVLDDELTLQNTALSMHSIREVVSVHKGYWVAGNFEVIEGNLDKRPFLFPYVVSVVHDLTGYRATNVFYLNFALGLGVILVAYILFTSWFGPVAAFLALLPFAAAPLFVLSVRSGGFEVMNLLYLGLLGVALSAYWRQSDTRGQAFLILTAVVLSYLRYESVAILLLVGAVIVCRCWREGRVAFGGVTVLSPLLMIPYVWLFRCTTARVGAWHVAEAEKISVFSFQYVKGNVVDAVAFLYAWDWGVPNDYVFSFAGSLGIVALCFWFWRSFRGGGDVFPELSQAVYAWLTGFAVLLVILLLYFWSSFLDPLAQRMSLPFLWVFALGCACLIARGIQCRKLFEKIAMLVVCGGLLFSTLPSLVHSKELRQDNLLGRLQSWKMHWAQLNQIPRDRVLFIDDNSHAWTTIRMPVIRTSQAKARIAQIDLHQKAGTFDAIYWIEIVRRGAGGEWSSVSEPLGAEFVFAAEPIAEFQMTASKRCRIRELTSIDHTPGLYEAFWSERKGVLNAEDVYTAFDALLIRSLP